MRRVLLILAVALTVVGVDAIGPATSSAKVAVGIGEQKPVFQNPVFTQLRTKRVRYVAPWNVARNRSERAKFDIWYSSARKARQEVLVSFSIAAGCKRPRRGKCGLPSVRSYATAFKAFRKRYRRIKVISPWNEANHRSQPTFKNPKRAAQFYNYVRKRCKGCRIVAADVIDESNMVRWLSVFKRHAVRPRIWGLHNYRDTNPRRKGGRTTAGGTARLLRTVRGQVWMTETGGLVFFRSVGAFRRPSAARADKAIKRMFRLAKRYRSRVKRLYIYQFQAPSGPTQFDAGLIAANGTSKRAGYNTVKRVLSTQRRYYTR